MLRYTPRRSWTARVPSVLSPLTLAVSLAVSPVAFAAAEPEGEPSSPPTEQSPEEEKERLQQLFESARTLYDEGQYEAAVTAFEAAYEVSPEPNLLYNVYVCYERLDRLDEALTALDRYAEVAPDSEADQIKRDRRNLLARMERGEGDPVGDGEPTTAPADSSTDQGPKERIFGPAAWALTAVTGVALGVGIGFGVSSNNLANDAQDQCASTATGPVCPESADSDMDKARNRGIVADVSFGVAGAAAVALIAVIAVKASRRGKASSTATLLTPYGSPTGAGLQLRARF